MLHVDGQETCLEAGFALSGPSSWILAGPGNSLEASATPPTPGTVPGPEPWPTLAAGNPVKPLLPTPAYSIMLGSANDPLQGIISSNCKD